MKKVIVTLKTYQQVIVSVVFIIACMAGFFLGVYPAAQTVLAQLGRMNDMTEEVRKLKNKSNILDELDETLLRDQLNLALSAVPSDKSIPTVLSTIESAAGMTGVSLLDVNVAGGFGLATNSASKESPLETRVGTRIIPASVTVEGNTEAIERFISMVPSVRRLLRIRNFSITFAQESRLISVVVQLDAFYAPFPTSLGGAAAEVAVLSKDEKAQLESLRQLPLLSAGSGQMPPPNIGRTKDNPFAP